VLEIRPLLGDDSLSELTALLHRAYRPLAEAGMRYVASHQDEQTTRRRAIAPDRECVLAVENDRILGTIVLGHPGAKTHHHACPDWYRRPDVATFEQFAVEPSRQRQGIGSLLLNWAETRAAELGAAEIACDTSEHAAHLIGLYTTRGYRMVDRVQWGSTNYRSIVLSKAI
jgi:GNAT superfamily N-acetyltransferase